MVYRLKIRKKEEKNQRILEMYEKAIKELKDFYELDWNKNCPIIYLLETRQDFDMITGQQNPDWIIGKAISFNKVALIAPESFDEESSHEYSDEEFFFLVKHELSHLFYLALTNGKGPVWFEEGFAVYTSGELKIMEKPSEFTKFLKYEERIDDEIYKEVGFVIDCLIDRCSKKRVLQFLDIIKNKDNSGFKKEFQEYFKMEMTYPEFNKLLRN